MVQPQETHRPPLRTVLESYVSVTGATYAAKAGDRLIGVNRAGTVTVTLPPPNSAPAGLIPLRTSPAQPQPTISLWLRGDRRRSMGRLRTSYRTITEPSTTNPMAPTGLKFPCSRRRPSPIPPLPVKVPVTIMPKHILPPTPAAAPTPSRLTTLPPPMTTPT